MRGKDKEASGKDSEMSAELEKLQIGFADPAEKPWLLESRFLGLAEFAPDGKVGGRPSWLSLSSLPEPSAVACGRCGAPMAFLLQVYAPYHWDHAFHRAVFVFMCKKAECHAPDEAAAPFAVFRSQLERCARVRWCLMVHKLPNFLLILQGI